MTDDKALKYRLETSVGFFKVTVKGKAAIIDIAAFDCDVVNGSSDWSFNLIVASAIAAVIADDERRDLSIGVNAATGDETITDYRAVGRITIIIVLDFVTRQRSGTLYAAKALRPE